MKTTIKFYLALLFLMNISLVNSQQLPQPTANGWSYILGNNHIENFQFVQDHYMYSLACDLTCQSRAPDFDPAGPHFDYVFYAHGPCQPDEIFDASEPFTTSHSGYCYNPFYIAILPLDLPESSCQSQVGNPVDSATGFKHQIETDIDAKNSGGVRLQRFYNNINSSQPWRHTYEAQLSALDSTKVTGVKAVSTAYVDKSMACTSGWADIKTKISDSWALNTSANFADGVCNVIANGKVIRRLGIIKNIAQSIYLIPEVVRLFRPNGAVIEYQYTNINAEIFVATNGDRGTLQRINTGAVMWKYKTTSGEVEEYSADGKLLSITAPNGIKQTLIYDVNSGILNKVQDSVGGQLTFAYINSKLSNVMTADNKTTNYTYNTAGLITDVKRPDNTHRLYHYEDSRFPTYLTGITDERNVRFATWKYDAQGRAISSEHASGVEKTLLAFNTDGSTTVTNALNKQTIYKFADIAGARRVTSVEGQPTANCVGANQNYTYTPEGWIESKTDWKGNKTFYQYNTKGQEVSRTEAYGTALAKTITTEWHATLNLKAKVTEPGKETSYSYDANGLLLNQNTRSLP